ncbi:MAG: dihydrodipicolinate synthase family protein [Phycisphaerales bacterium]
MSTHSKKRFHGIITPMVTPLADLQTLDKPGLERLINHLLEGGVDGIFALGTTGEGPSHSYALRRELVERTVDQVAGRVPVLVGITDTAASEAITMARFCKDAGVDAVVLAPPCYFKPRQPELLNYYREMARRCAMPMFMYNIPSQTGVSIDPMTVAGALEERNVIGFKDSSGDMTYFNRLRGVLAERPDIALLVGPEELLAEALIIGAHGGVPGGSNLCPRLFASMMDASIRNDLPELLSLHNRVMDISNRLYGIGQYSSSFLTSIKTSLKYIGICNDALAMPFGTIEQSDRETIRRHLVSLGLLPEGRAVTTKHG